MRDQAQIFFHYLQTKASSRMSRARLERHQQWQLKRLLAFAVKNSSYTRERFSQLSSTASIENWQQLPVMTKMEMMQHFSQLTTTSIHYEEAYQAALQAEQSGDSSAMVKGYTAGLSSGTSGQRGLFLLSRAERLRWAGVILAKLLPGPLWQRERLAFFLRANNRLYGSVASKSLAFEYFNLGHPFEEHLTRLNHFQPSILVAPASMLRRLASAQGTALHIHPQKIISVAEILDAIDQDIISQAFRQPLHQVYQATEGFLASSCEHGNLHLNEDLMIIERHYLDEAKTRFMPIITDLYRRSQPFIRYRLDDILIARQDPCLCGSGLQAIRQIEGRLDDVFVFAKKDTQGWQAVYPDHIRKAILQASKVLKSYHVWQRSSKLVEVYVSPKGVATAVLEALRGVFASYPVEQPSLHLLTTPPQRPTHEKQRRVQRCFQPANPPFPL